MHLRYFFADGGKCGEFKTVCEKRAFALVGLRLHLLPLKVYHHLHKSGENGFLVGKIEGQIAGADISLFADLRGCCFGKAILKK